MDEKEVASSKVLLLNGDYERHYESKDDHYLPQGMADVLNIQMDLKHKDQAIKQILTGYFKSLE